LLVREGLGRVVSANWDCGVENGGRRVDVAIEGVSHDIDGLRLPIDALAIYKVHGCARCPETLVLTRQELDKSRRWARAKVQHALMAGTVVFVGLGTLGAYVGETVEELTDLWVGETTTVRVVDPCGLSEPWRVALAEHAGDVELKMGAEEFLDDLLRAVISRALSRIGDIAHDLDRKEQQSWSAAGLAGHKRLLTALAAIPADAVLRWWRDGVTPAMNGSTFIFGRGVGRSRPRLGCRRRAEPCRSGSCSRPPRRGA
jgi:hypothetical protein